MHGANFVAKILKWTFVIFAGNEPMPFVIIVGHTRYTRETDAPTMKMTLRKPMNLRMTMTLPKLVVNRYF